jgi:hypothetical protein
MSLGRATRLAVVLLLSSAISGIPSTAGSIIVGSAIRSVNASIAQRALKTGTTILNGDSLRVDDGTALVGLEDGSRITLGKDTIVSFQTESRGVTTVVDHGTLDFLHPAKVDSVMRMQIADVYVVPGKGFETLGAIAMAGDTLVVMARQGSLRVEGGGRSVEVGEGKMITLHSQPARAPQISATTARPAFVHDVKVAGVTVIGAVALALLVNHLISSSNKTNCQDLIKKINASPVIPPPPECL